MTDDTPITGLLGDLARRREEIRGEQQLTLMIPRWENPKIKITFKPVDHPVLRRVAQQQERGLKEKDSRKLAKMELDTNADLLVHACVEIVAVTADGKEVGMGPNGVATRFDPDLAISLGLPDTVDARTVCEYLFITDGDLLSMARQISEWSGYRNEDADGELVGES